MSRRAIPSDEGRVCHWSFFVAACLHLGVVAFLMLAGNAQPEMRYQELAVMEFAHFDPGGGEPGGGDDEMAAAPEPAPAAEAEQAAPPEEVEAIAETEPEPQVVESVSEEAAPMPPPPPVEKARPRPKPAHKPKPKPKPAPDSALAGGPTKIGEAQAGGSAPGGGPGTAQGGIGGGTGQGNPNAYKAYTAAIQKKLNRYKKYPSGARSRKLEGVVTVNFTVNRGGTVVASRLVKSSGHPELDEEALALLKRVSPFRPMPKDMPQRSIDLNAPIQFSVR